MKMYFDALVRSTCPNGYEDVRSYNEIELARLCEILHGLKSGDHVLITYLFDGDFVVPEH